MFVDRSFRQNPGKILGALAAAGVSIATLYLMFLAVTVIDVSLTLTAFSKFLSVDVLTFLRAFDIGSGSVWFVLLALLLTMVLAVVLGMGMPAVPAYINVALLLGPMLVGHQEEDVSRRHVRLTRPPRRTSHPCRTPPARPVR